jgi:hypothetical protein
LNLTICVSINESLSGSNDVVPNAPYLNASYQQYPAVGTTIYLDVYSVYDLQKNWGGSGGTGEFLGPTAYLYLSVTDVEWNGIPWFCSCDQSVWHANGVQNWAPKTFINANKTLANVIYNPNTGPGSLVTRYLYSLQISGTAPSTSGKSAPNFPSGSYVQWNVTSVHLGSNGHPYMNSTSVQMGGPFSYYVNSAWYWSSASCLPNQPCYPNAPTPYSSNCPTDGMTQSAAAFRCNLNMVVNPSGQPTIGTKVVVSLQVNNTWQMYTGAKLDGAVLYLSAYFPNGSLWREWSTGFTGINNHFPTEDANATIPSAFFYNVNSSISYYVVAWDQSNDTLQSQNNTLITSNYGTFPGKNFSLDINLTTNPANIGHESQNGTINGFYPQLSYSTQLNITISSQNATIGIQLAEIFMRLNFTSAGITETPAFTMKRVTNAEWTYLVEALPAGTNATFLVKAEDYNEVWVTSHLYHYYIPAIPKIAPAGEGIFEVHVYDNASKQYLNGAFVNITGEGGSPDIHTYTVLGIAYPNVTNNHFAYQFLQLNTTYSVTVAWNGFQAADAPLGTNTLKVLIYLTSPMTAIFTLESGPNYFVQERGNIIYFALNVPPPPPTFSAMQGTTLPYLEAGLGMAAATALVIPVYFMWTQMRRKAEEEEKRITL